MSTFNNYEEWLDPTGGLKPHRNKHDGSFNNIVFSAELILGKIMLGQLKDIDLEHLERHLELNADGNGLYAPKNSHDNITAKLVVESALFMSSVHRINLKEAIKGKHPRDKILYSFWVSPKSWHWLVMPIALLDIVRSILTGKKVRPDWWDKDAFLFRLKIAFGLIKPAWSEPVTGGESINYIWKGREKQLLKVQSDGRILSLLRLYLLKRHKILKPFVKLCKMLYTFKHGKNFQSVMFANYFEESDHPVRTLFEELDRRNITLLD